MRVYADADALEAYPGGATVPAGSVEAYLRTASRTVDLCLVGVRYDTDTDGMPTDTDVAQALSDAACAIAVEASAAGVLTPSGGQWSSVAIGSVRLSGKQQAEGVALVRGVPVPVAAQIALQSVGPHTFQVL